MPTRAMIALSREEVGPSHPHVIIALYRGPLLIGASVLVAIGLYGLAMLFWAIRARPSWWQVRTELYGFLRFAAAAALFFAFNLFASSYLFGPPVIWFLSSLAGLGWLSFRIHQKFNSSWP
jgi:hypothetical protein